MGGGRLEGGVLVVDDDPELRRLTARVPTKAGHEVVAVRTTRA
jgi:CheY-like chemotaxis protein